ncbi:MAG: hypothetical protein OIF56_10880 [Cohaesibacter sp.]|nr:hypothetical protein [Cohaesibacter sp.]MCV6599976.1 hypothetical protein [Cohaesibacter sp.]
MQPTAPIYMRKSARRHSIELSAKKRQEQSIAKGFKLWLCLYLAIMTVGLVMASAQSMPTAPVNTQDLKHQKDT